VYKVPIYEILDTGKKGQALFFQQIILKCKKPDSEDPTQDLWLLFLFRSLLGGSPSHSFFSFSFNLRRHIDVYLLHAFFFSMVVQSKSKYILLFSCQEQKLGKNACERIPHSIAHILQHWTLFTFYNIGLLLLLQHRTFLAFSTSNSVYFLQHWTLLTFYIGFFLIF
jgi:hypothetical protein